MFLPLSVMVKGMNLSDERCGSLAREPVVSLETGFWSLFIRMGSGHFLKGQVLPFFFSHHGHCWVGNNRLPHLSYGLQILLLIGGVFESCRGWRRDAAGDNQCSPCSDLLTPWALSSLLLSSSGCVPASGLRPDLGAAASLRRLGTPWFTLLDECNIMGDVPRHFRGLCDSVTYKCEAALSVRFPVIEIVLLLFFMPYISYLSNGDCRISLESWWNHCKDYLCICVFERLWIFYLIKQNFIEHLVCVCVCVHKNFP